MGITRLHYKNQAPGWWVRYHYVDGNPEFQKVFKDRDYMNSRAANIAASKYLSKLKREHPYEEKPLCSRQINPRGVSQHKLKSTQPIHGVARRTHIHGDYWDATVSHEKYKQIHKTFSVGKYGERESERLAIMARILFLHSHPVKECRPIYVSFV